MHSAASPPSAPPALAQVSARDVMTPGVVVISVTAPVAQAADALTAHGAHAVLVISCKGRPAGWFTATPWSISTWYRLLVTWAGDAMAERVTAIGPHAPLEEIVEALSQPGVTRLAVQERPDRMPEGVISDIDLAGFVGHRP